MPVPDTGLVATVSRRARLRAVVRYLSLDWIDALSAAVSASDSLQELATTVEIGITQVVTDGPEGDVAYHLQVGGGTAAFGAGAAEPEDLRFVQDWETAVAVATGAMSAQDAFVTGSISLSGDSQKLIASEPVFRELDAVFANVREQTDYS